MIGKAGDGVFELRQHAEGALSAGRGDPEVHRCLERIIELAEPGDADALFAHHHLAELLVEGHPWRAALHLRQVLRVESQDDAVHALMGLCQALLGNYKSAIASYTRALEAAPHTPWYHHNLGHLLDIGMERPEAAERHLRAAHRLEPEHDEITASLAHCLARRGALQEATMLAEAAVLDAPNNPEHRKLLRWVEDGAPVDGVATEALRPKRAPPSVPPPDSPPLRVRAAFESRMQEGGFSRAEVDCARLLWADFHRDRSVRLKKPEVFAAAVEYAVAVVQGRSGATQASIARRYGVAATSLSQRFGQIRDALDLEPGDPRYAACP